MEAADQNEKWTGLAIAQQKFLAFEGLLAWAKAVVLQANRIAATEDLRRRMMDGYVTASRRGNRTENPARALSHTFQAERHLFCVAAGKLFDHRFWIRDLALLDEDSFAGIDEFERDVRAMRNFNEHAVEYFKGPGKFPAEWKRQKELFNSDPTGTQGTLIGGRLDWRKLTDATNALLEKLANHPPFYYSQPA